MIGDIMDQMCHGIDESQIVVVFITRNYMEKVRGANSIDNCKIEFNYAVGTKKPEKMVAVVMEKEMRDTSQWRGPLRAALGNSLYVDFSDEAEEKFEANCLNLLREITGRITPLSPLPVAAGSVGKMGPRKPLASLSVAEVGKLLENCRMSNFSAAFIANEVDGEVLLHTETVEDLVLLGVTMAPRAKAFLAKINDFRANGGVPADLLTDPPLPLPVSPGSISPPSSSSSLPPPAPVPAQKKLEAPQSG
jgi:hypothetical protein